MYTLRSLFVGINDYNDASLRTEKKKLSFARADAEEMARVWGQSNTLKVGKIELLTDKRATYGAVWRNLNEVFLSNSTFDSETIALFYFAGHGLIDPADDKRVLLACCDVNAAFPGQGGIHLNDITNMLINSSAGCSIAIIDACFSGGITDIRRIVHESPVEQAKKAIWIARGTDQKVVAIFTACSSYQEAHENPASGHGTYTNELLRGLRDGEARNQVGIVNLNSLKDYLEQRFEKYREINQEPQQEIIGRGLIPLYQYEPITPGVVQHAAPALEVPRPLTDIIRRHVLPPEQPKNTPSTQPANWKEQIRKLAVPVIISIGALTACSVLTVFVEPLRTGFFGLIFGLGIIFALSSFALGSFIPAGRVVAAILAPVQLILLVGFAYDHFHWGASVSALAPTFAFIAGFEWLFWTLMGIEMLLLLLLASLTLLQL